MTMLTRPAVPALESPEDPAEEDPAEADPAEEDPAEDPAGRNLRVIPRTSLTGAAMRRSRR